MARELYKDGGPAFPVCSEDYPFIGENTGMSLRDYFAAKIMQGLMAGFDFRPDAPTVYSSLGRRADWAYKAADLMLGARLQRNHHVPSDARKRDEA